MKNKRLGFNKNENSEVTIYAILVAEWIRQGLTFELSHDDECLYVELTGGF